MPKELSNQEIMSLEKAMDRVQQEYESTGKVDPLYLARADAWSSQGAKTVVNSTDTNGKDQRELVSTDAHLKGWSLLDWADEIVKTRETADDKPLGKDTMTVKTGVWQSPMLPGHKEDSWQVKMQRKLTDANGRTTFEANLKCNAKFGSAYAGTGIPRIGSCEGTFKTASGKEANYSTGKYADKITDGYYRHVYKPGNKSMYIIRGKLLEDPATGKTVAVAGYETGSLGYTW